MVATQATAEYDSFSDDYDLGAAYSVITVDELKYAVSADKYVVLAKDITVPFDKLSEKGGYGKQGIFQGNGGVIDGNGNTISAERAGRTWDSTIQTEGGTIRNATITGGFRGIFIADAKEDIIIENVIINPGAYPINCDSRGGYKLIVNNSTLNGWTSYAETLESATFTNCKFTSNGSYARLRPYTDTTLINCEIEEDFILDTSRSTGEIILINCTSNGEPITAANLIDFLSEDAECAIIG